MFSIVSTVILVRATTQKHDEHRCHYYHMAMAMISKSLPSLLQVLTRFALLESVTMLFITYANKLHKILPNLGEFRQLEQFRPMLGDVGQIWSEFCEFGTILAIAGADASNFGRR